MAKSLFNRTNPGDAANIFVRNLLCDLSDTINPNGFTESDSKKTLLFFEHRCPYTGKKLTKSNMVLDHIIPHNKDSCGLHLFGNLVYTTKEVNAKKSSKSFEEFILLIDDSWIEPNFKKAELIERIVEFQEISGYKTINTKIQDDLIDVVKSKYQYIKALSETIKNEFQENNTIKNLKLDIESFSAKEILPKIKIWSTKPNLNVHKIIAYIALHKQITREVLIEYITNKNISLNPQGTINSLMSNKGNSYGKVLQENSDRIISFVPDIENNIYKYDWTI